MFCILLLTLALGAGGDQTFLDARLIRRLAEHKQRQRHATVTDAKGVASAPDAVFSEQDPIEDPGYSWERHQQLKNDPNHPEYRAEGSVTEIIVFIQGNVNGKMMQLASADYGAMRFSDNFDEKTEWVIQDHGDGLVRIQSVHYQNTYLKDGGAIAHHSTEFGQAEHNLQWKLQPTVDHNKGSSGFKLKSNRAGKYLKAAWANSVHIEPDDQGSNFVWKLAIKQVVWGGCANERTCGNNFHVYLIAPHGGILKQASDSHLNLDGSQLGDASSLWSVGSTGEAQVEGEQNHRDTHGLTQVLVQGHNSKYLADYNGTLTANGTMGSTLYENPVMLWTIKYKQDGQIMLGSHQDRHLEEDDDNKPRMSKTWISEAANVEKYGSRLWTLELQSVTF